MDFFFLLPEHLLSLCSSPPARGQRCSAAECVLFVCVCSFYTVQRVSWIRAQCVSCCFHLYHACIYRERVLFTFLCSQQKERAVILISIPPTVPLIQPSLNRHQCNRIKVSSHHLHFPLLRMDIKIEMVIIVMLMVVKTTNTK